MKKWYKIGIFSGLGMIIALLFFLFLPSAKREIQTEKTEKTIEKSEIPKENIENQEAEEVKESEKTTSTENNISPKNENENEGESTPSQLISSRLVSWGYSSSKNRSIDTIIIHSSYNALGGDYYDLDKLIKEYKAYGVAPHYLIDRKGKIYQLVSDQNIAYHAGESKMPDGRINVNNFSLGIEIMNTENDKVADNQYESLEKLIDILKKKHKITSVLGHNQIAPGRKTDPWNFNWSKI